MDLQKDDVPQLDFLLDLLVKRGSTVVSDDLKDFDKYKQLNSSDRNSEFKRLMYFFRYFGCGEPSDNSGLAHWINSNLNSSQFQHSGGFENAYAELKNAKEKNDIEYDLKILQKESLLHKQTIRDQESRIRGLTEDLKFMSLIKHYWWFVLAALGFGWSIGKFLDKI